MHRLEEDRRVENCKTFKSQRNEQTLKHEKNIVHRISWLDYIIKKAKGKPCRWSGRRSVATENEIIVPANLLLITLKWLWQNYTPLLDDNVCHQKARRVSAVTKPSHYPTTFKAWRLPQGSKQLCGCCSWQEGRKEMVNLINNSDKTSRIDLVRWLLYQQGSSLVCVSKYLVPSTHPSDFSNLLEKLPCRKHWAWTLTPFPFSV